MEALALSHNPPLKKVGIVVNTTIERALATLWKLIRFLKARNIASFLEKGSIDALKALTEIKEYDILEEASIENLCLNADLDAVLLASSFHVFPLAASVILPPVHAFAALMAFCIKYRFPATSPTVCEDIPAIKSA